MTLPPMKHQQSMPNLSRSSKMSVVTTSRAIDQPRTASGRRYSAQPTTTLSRYSQQPQQPARRASTQPVVANSYKSESTQAASKVVPTRQQVSPAKDFKSRATREQSPASSVLSAKTTVSNNAGRQASRPIASSRYVATLSVSLVSSLFVYMLSQTRGMHAKRPNFKAFEFIVVTKNERQEMFAGRVCRVL